MVSPVFVYFCNFRLKSKVYEFFCETVLVSQTNSLVPVVPGQASLYTCRVFVTETIILSADPVVKLLKSR